MAVDVGKVSLELLTHVSVRERARLAWHEVPGLSGNLSQELGRPSVEVSLSGVFFGPNAAADLKALRDLFLDRKPVDFFADAVGEGYFTRVLVTGLRVAQAAGESDQFNYTCEIVEYIEPPEPAVADPFGDLDAGLLDEAKGFMDDVQNAVDQVSQLADLVAGAPSFGDPTARVSAMPGALQSVVGGPGLGVLTGVRKLF